MWKDPLFSAAILVITVLLFDLIATKGTIAATSKAWIPPVCVGVNRHRISTK